jgi:Protein of unknown function (DUF2934)/Electron transfer flavoprotein-ubiquinone oxidoreductase, 4Fe-4S
LASHQLEHAALELRAYYLWEANGRPEGRPGDYWAKAQALLEEQTSVPVSSGRHYLPFAQAQLSAIRVALPGVGQPRKKWQVLPIDGPLWILSHALESARIGHPKRQGQESVRRAAHLVAQTLWEETSNELFRADQGHVVRDERAGRSRRHRDINDPTQNIVWVTPEGGGGPHYPNM